MTIFETLQLLRLSSESTRRIYAERTRDISPLTVYKDSLSDVIFIDDFYTGTETYSDGSYRPEAYSDSLEAKQDCQRRGNTFQKFYTGLEILDFGCGAGDFLQAVRGDCVTAKGIELQRNYVDDLNANGIPCFDSLNSIEERSLDTIFSFHVLEHLPDPLASLLEMKTKLRTGGRLVIEVPHANDFLLDIACNEEFKRFTLWDQHLILHTRNSLKVMLAHCGFRDIVIEGVQRYPLSNHFQWLSKGIPGGHRSKFSMIDCNQLEQAYASALGQIDATDTLTAVAYI